MHPKNFSLREHDNCWRVSTARSGRFLIDGEDYFSDLYDALLQAEETIFIIGWDFDSRIDLQGVDRKRDSQYPSRIGELLSYLVTARPNLYIYILIWDYIELYATDRELFTKMKFFLKAHNRVRFFLDDTHPLGAAHHQKLVVIDDEVAYCGGFDISAGRWDTTQHAAGDPSRVNARGKAYPPFHDVQIRVEGGVARELGQLVRERWFNATNEKILLTNRTKSFVPFVTPDFYNMPVAIARTQPDYMGRSEVREIERLYLDLIASAKKRIYIENQYFTSEIITKVLIESLRKVKGPEVIILQPSTLEGWIEDKTMGTFRRQSFTALLKEDRYGRLGIFQPIIPGVGGGLKVHSKVMVVDDCYAMVGSSNIANRSMGLDTECNLLIDGGTSEAGAAAATLLQARLIGEHLGLAAKSVKAALDDGTSLLQLIKSRRHHARRLEPYRVEASHWFFQAMMGLDIIDPGRTLPIESEFDGVMSLFGRVSWRYFGRYCFLFGTCIGLITLGFIVFSALPARPWLNLGSLEETFRALRLSNVGPKTFLVMYAAAALMFVPINLVFLATATIFELDRAIFYSFFGALLYATLGYLIGRAMGQKAVGAVFIGKAHLAARKLAHNGILPVFYSRVTFWVPYALVNLVAGAAGVNFWKYFVGTAFGVMPGILALSLMQHNLVQFVGYAKPLSGLYFGALFILVVGWVVVCRRRFGINRL